MLSASPTVCANSHISDSFEEGSLNGPGPPLPPAVGRGGLGHGQSSRPRLCDAAPASASSASADDGGDDGGGTRGGHHHTAVLAPSHGSSHRRAWTMEAPSATFPGSTTSTSPARHMRCSTSASVVLTGSPSLGRTRPGNKEGNTQHGTTAQGLRNTKPLSTMAPLA